MLSNTSAYPRADQLLQLHGLNAVTMRHLPILMTFRNSKSNGLVGGILFNLSAGMMVGLCVSVVQTGLRL